MNQVLILTRNILAEQEMQQKLQALNYEVYCSTKFFERCSQRVNTVDFFQFFQYVMLSETICESEVMELVPLIENPSIRIIRKVETQATEMDHKLLEEGLLNAVISKEDLVDELRECLYTLKRELAGKEQLDKGAKIVQLSEKVSLMRTNSLQKMSLSPEDNYKLLDVMHHLSQTETRILYLLIQAGNQIVTREAICHEIWNEEVNKSHLASLSSTVTRIKGKFEQTNLSHKAIQTLWGKGYRINPELLDRIQKNDALNSVVSNG